MDHNLEESLKLGVGFEHSVVLSEETDICLDDSNVGKTMEFETIEEQQILMDTEVIHNVGETYSLQMSGNDMPMLGGEEEVFSQESIDTLIDNSISQELDTVSQNHSLETMEANTVKTDDVLISHVSIKPVPSEPTQVTSVQVNIAPPSSANNPAISSETIKPTLANIKIVSRSKEFLPIAPKPWTTNRPQTVTVTTASKPKQIIIPSNSTQQKIKIVSSGLQYIQDDKGHLYTAKRVGNKQILTKVASHPTKDTNTSEATSVNKPRIVSSGLPKLVMAKVLTPNGDMMTRYIPVEAAQQMGIVQRRQTITNAGNKVFMPSLRHQSLITTPTKQVVTIKQPTVQPKLAPISTQGVPQKKVLITPVSSVQNVVLRSAPPKSIQMSSKESKLAGGAVLTNIAPAPQKQQKVQQSITVPGKGVQYIRLVQPSIKGQQSVLNVANKAVLVTDAQGNLLQMSTEEPIEPQLLVAAANKIHQQQQVKVNKTPNQKLVVLSPASQQNANFPQIVRVSGQSILKAKQKQTIQIVKAEEKAIKEIDEKIPAAGAISIIQDKETVMNETLDQISSNQKEKEKSLTTTRDEVQVTEKENSCGVINDETVDTPIGVVDDSNSSQLEKPSQDTSNEQEELEEEDDGEEIEPKWKKMRQNSNIDYSRHDESKNDEKIQDYNIEIEPALLEEFKSKYEKGDSIKDLVMRSRKACNCTKSQCLKLYCDCFANGEFCNGCNCFSCHNNLEHEELRQVAIRGCLERNPRAFRPKIGKAKEEPTRRHFKGCNCKRSGCLKNYCECFEAKIACSGKCKCVGCRNVDEMLHRVNYDNVKTISTLMPPMLREPCSLVTSEVVEAVCQCLMAAASESEATRTNTKKEAATIAVLFEFSRCLRDVISASARAQATT